MELLVSLHVYHRLMRVHSKHMGYMFFTVLATGAVAYDSSRSNKHVSNCILVASFCLVFVEEGGGVTMTNICTQNA